MKKSSVLFLSAIVFFLFSCSTEKGLPFELKGEIKGAENKKVTLESMTFPNSNDPRFTIIDTVRADEKGKFQIKN
ncbi:MAG: hypothetical protein ACHQFW_12335, partial [Chitinophagales bacterium]